MDLVDVPGPDAEAFWRAWGGCLDGLRPVASVPLADRLLLRAETLADHGFLDEAGLIARLASTNSEPAEAWTESAVRREIEQGRRHAERRSAPE